jgi:hypothetical protein
MDYNRTWVGLDVDCNPACDSSAEEAPRGDTFGRFECLQQLLQAFFDIADRDDIHQAAQRLSLVQQWIRDETDRAAADPIFSELLPA